MSTPIPDAAIPAIHDTEGQMIANTERMLSGLRSGTCAALVCWIGASCAADATIPHTIPAAPTNIVAKALESQIVGITWTDNAPNEEAFRVERAPTPDGPWTTVITTTANVKTARDRGLSSEERYCYRVTAANAMGESAPTDVACVVPPAAPTRLTTALASGPQVVLSWLPHSPSATGYEILRAVDLEMLSRVGTTGVASTYTDHGVVAGRTYYYEVRAISPGGMSGGTNISTIFVLQLESHP